jgi:hypothetical protein
MFTPSRDEARRFFIDAWAKYRAQQPLTGLEQTAAGISSVCARQGATSMRRCTPCSNAWVKWSGTRSATA